MVPRHCVDLFLGVGQARWRPLYDLYAYSQDGKPSTSVSLHYRVNLSQSTGEDWNDAKLILSTSETDVLNAGIPISDSLVIEQKLKPPQLPAGPGIFEYTKKTKRKAGFMPMAEELPPSMSDDGDDRTRGGILFSGFSALLPDMSEGGAVVSKSPMAVNYTVDELTTIPSDGVSHKVLVASIPLEAAISHITTPRKSPLAYLQVYPSPVSIHRTTHRVAPFSAQ